MVQSHLYGDIELAICKVSKTNKDIVTGQKGNPYMSFDEDKKLKIVNFNYCPIAA